MIGDYDLGKKYLYELEKRYFGGISKGKSGIDILGYLGDERFEVYKQSKIVLYPARWDHFSMSPVEAMACGCPMIAFNLPVMKYLKGLKGCALIDDMQIETFATAILDYLKGRYKERQKGAIEYAQTWDWRIRTKQVWDEIGRAL